MTPVADGRWEHSRRYLEETLVLETTLHGPTGEARVTDCFTLGDDAPGHVHLDLTIAGLFRHAR